MAMIPVVGQLLDGKYRIEAPLGAGGMGQVVKARQLVLEELVALKFLLPESAAQPALVERLYREARAAARIKSEHVARVLDVAVHPDYGPFIVMEYLEGEDLAALVAREGPLPIERALGYVLEACSALAEAHYRGVVHRDLKPSNLFLAHRPDGTTVIKVLDFGVAKLVDPDTSGGRRALTNTAMIMGSFPYMSPEQLRSARDVDRRADVWSLGVIVHQLVSGRLPFEGATPAEIITKIAADAPARLREHLPGAPEALEELVLGCLEKDRERRIGTVSAIAAELAAFVPDAEARVAAIARLDRLSSLPDTDVGDESHTVRRDAVAKAPPSDATPSQPVADAPVVESGDPTDLRETDDWPRVASTPDAAEAAGKVEAATPAAPDPQATAPFPAPFAPAHALDVSTARPWTPPAPLVPEGHTTVDLRRPLVSRVWLGAAGFYAMLSVVVVILMAVVAERDAPPFSSALGSVASSLAGVRPPTPPAPEGSRSVDDAAEPPTLPPSDEPRPRSSVRPVPPPTPPPPPRKPKELEYP
jgi:serine/threonine-protein kinase